MSAVTEEQFKEFKLEVREDSLRLEGKVDGLARDIADLRVESAKSATRATIMQAILMSIVGVGAGIVGALMTANVLGR